MNFWAKVKSNTFNIKLLWLLFGQLLENFGLIFNLASGHSGWLLGKLCLKTSCRFTHPSFLRYLHFYGEPFYGFERFVILCLLQIASTILGRFLERRSNPIFWSLFKRWIPNESVLFFWKENTFRSLNKINPSQKFPFFARAKWNFISWTLTDSLFIKMGNLHAEIWSQNPLNMSLPP